MAQKELVGLYIGKEAAWGVPVPATEKLMLVNEFKAETGKETSTIASLGSLAGVSLATVKGLKPTGSMTVVLSIEQLHWYLNGYIGQAVDVDGVQVWNQGRTRGNCDSYTLHYCGDGVGWRISGVRFTKLNIKFGAGELWEATVEFVGKSITPATSEPNLPDIAVTPLSANSTFLYLDEFGGEIGATRIVSLWSSMEISLESGIDTRHGIGGVHPAVVSGTGRANETINFDLDLDSESAALYEEIMGDGIPMKLLRVVCETEVGNVTMDASVHIPNAGELPVDNDGVLLVSAQSSVIEIAKSGLPYRLSFRLETPQPDEE